MFAPHVSCPHVFLRPTCVPRASSWFIFAVLLLVFSFWNRLSLFLSVLLPVFDYSLFIIKACFLFLSLPASVYIASQCSCNVEVAQRTRKTQICRWRLKKCQRIAKASRIRPRWTVNVWNISTTNLRPTSQCGTNQLINVVLTAILLESHQCFQGLCFIRGETYSGLCIRQLPE